MGVHTGRGIILYIDCTAFCDKSTAQVTDEVRAFFPWLILAILENHSEVGKEKKEGKLG